MSIKQLAAKKRNLKVKPTKLRRQGFIPGTIYGGGMDSVSVEVNTHDFHKGVYAKTDLIDLDCEKEKYKVLLRKSHKHPVTDEILNLEFFLVNDNKHVVLEVPIKFVGIPPGVKLGGSLWTPISTVKVKAFPKDIPDFLEVDLSILDALSSILHVGEIYYPPGVTPVSDGRIIVAKIIPPKVKE